MISLRVVAHQLLRGLRGAYAPTLVRGNRQRLREARRHMDAAADLLQDVVLSLDLRYATQDPDWQEGKQGQANCQIADVLREWNRALHKMAWEDMTRIGGEELG